MEKIREFDFRKPLRLGGIASVVTLSLSVIGMVELFSQRALVAGIPTLGQFLVLGAPVFLAYSAAKDMSREKWPQMIGAGLLIGLVASLPTIVLILIESAFDLRQFLPNVSPALMDILTFNLEGFLGILALVLAMMVSGMIGSLFYILPEKYRRPILSGVIWTLLIGMFSEILSNRLRDFFGADFMRLVFTGKALNPVVALIFFLLICTSSGFWTMRGDQVQTRWQDATKGYSRQVRWATVGIGIAILVFLPMLLGTYLSEVFNNVGLYVLMGLGLNIVVGFAGLLDLGYVAFFAIGAYSMAVMTTEGHLAVGNFTFWTALPISVLMSVLAGVILGIPVLRMRGDYLAIVTLGFGEIIRVLATSDMLKPFIGGAQGVLQIPKPKLGSMSLVQPEHLYYVILAGVLIAWFVSWRLSESRLGRQWMAMREDEDVAEAMGIRLVATKLLAFGIGAGFSGLSGAIYASKLTSIFPHSFSLIVSINVLSLIIVGGIGSLPGVVVGALILVGLPELLREFAEHRLLMYGIVLIVMMLAKPEGLLPSSVRQREMTQEALDEDQAAVESAAVSGD
jgi:branched-chain amino acid transport system permease protein